MTSSSTFPPPSARRMTSAPPPPATPPAARRPWREAAGAPPEGDAAAPGRLSRRGERRVEARHEPEAGRGRRLIRDAVGEYEQGSGERVGPAPPARRVVHAAADHPG